MNFFLLYVGDLIDVGDNMFWGVVPGPLSAMRFYLIKSRMPPISLFGLPEAESIVARLRNIFR